MIGSWWKRWRYGAQPPARQVMRLRDGAVLSVVTWGAGTAWVLAKDDQRVELTYREADQLYFFLAAHLGVLPETK